MNGQKNVYTGIWGEMQAMRLLRKEGYRILNWRYRGGGGEIDLIARDGQTYVFVEVKARPAGRLGDGVQAVDQGKRRRIRSAARVYLQKTGQEACNVRFDVVEITRAGARHMVNAF